MLKSKKILCLLLSAFVLMGNVNAIDMAPLSTDPEETVLEIEAEKFNLVSGFKLSEDNLASEQNCIISYSDGESYCKFTLDYTVDDLVIYAVHKSSDIKSNLSYFALDHMEDYSLYDYSFNEWNSTRLFYGQVTKGEHTIHLKSVRMGQKIDKFIIKYKRAQDSEIKAATDDFPYEKGTEENNKLNISEVEEKQPGSFFFEAENSTMSDSMSIGYDDSASGGAYWYAPHDAGLKHLTEADMTDEIFARFKFNVSIKGKYKMWVRYYTPQAMQKTTWFAVDNKDYYRLEDNFSDAWEWAKTSKTYYLDEGTHTLDIKYRQPGQRIDCVILTMVDSFTAAGIGSLPGEPIVLGAGEYRTIANVAKLSKLKVNNYRAKPDEEFVIMKNDIVVPSTSVTALLGKTLEEHDDSYVVYTGGRGYLKFFINSEKVIINGEVKKAPHKAYRHNGVIPMVSLSVLQDAFRFDYQYNEKQNTINIFYNPTENYREAKEGEILTEGGERTIYYSIPHNSPNAKVEVWIKYNLGDEGLFRRQNYDNMNSLATGGCIYKYVTMSNWMYWKKAPDPIYKDGAFRGCEFVSAIAPHDIKVRIIENGKEDTFVAHNAVSPNNITYTTRLSAKDYAYKTNGELLLVPTFENMSYYIDYSNEGATCDITYRKSGSDEWKKALSPYYDTVVGQFRGSIVGLCENTDYEVKAQLKDKSGASISEKTSSIKTWTSDVPIEKTVKLKDIYSGNGTLLIQGLHGSEKGWIKIEGDGQTVDASTDITTEAVMFTQSHHVIFENVKVRGGGIHGVLVGEGCSDIRIVNCDIARWGQEVAYDEQYGRHQRNGALYNNSGGIYLMNAKNTVIERCYIHDCKITTNEWNNDDYKNIHPAGGTGIQQMGVFGYVARYNDIIGSDSHRFNDVMEGTSNGSRNNSSTGSDADIYGNMMIYGEDDCIETDGGQMNVRVYKNRMEQARCGISSAPNMMGPSYFFNNLIINLGGSWHNESGSAIKAGGGPDGVIGRQYYINNTMDSEATGPVNINYSGSSEYHAFSRNNIFVTHKSTRLALGNKFSDERDDFDYDLIYGGLYSMQADAQEKHAIFEQPQYKDSTNGIYQLLPDSPGKGGGTYIDNFNEELNPDVGAFCDSRPNSFLPFRPVDMYADKYRIELKDGEIGEITVSLGNIGSERTYSIVKNMDFNWLEIIEENCTDVPAKENSSVTFRIKGDMTKCIHDEGKGMVLFRLDNGFSIPITVYCTK